MSSITSKPSVSGLLIDFVVFANGRGMQNVNEKIRTNSQPGTGKRPMKFSKFKKVLSFTFVIEKK